MGTPIVLTSFSDVVQKLAMCADWLREVTGVSVSETRVQQTISFLRDSLDATRSEATRNKLLTNFEFAEVLCDAVELIQIHSAFVNLPLDDVGVMKLAEIASGPFLVREEKPGGASQRPRNISFELLLSSYFRGMGLSIAFDAPTDFSASGSRVRYYVECTRPQLLTAVQKRAREARKALTSKMTSDLGCLQQQCGLVGLAMTKAFTTEHQLLGVEREEDVRSVLSAAAGRIITDIRPAIDKAVKKPLVGGVVAHLSIPVFVKDKSWMPVVGTQLAFYVTAAPYTPEGVAIRQLATELRNDARFKHDIVVRKLGK